MIKRTIYVGNPAYLSLKNAQMILRRPDVEQDVSIPIEDMGLLVLDNQQITVTQGLMAQLLANNCAVVTCDNKCMPVGLLLPLDGHTLQSERFRAQIDSSKPLRKQLWQQTVQAKIANQATILHQLTGAEVGNMRTISRPERQHTIGEISFLTIKISRATGMDGHPTTCSTMAMPYYELSSHARWSARDCCQRWAYTTTTNITPIAWLMTSWSHTDHLSTGWSSR